MPDLVGQTLGKYQLVDRLGRGGMADVYKAYQPGLDRYVAIKVLHPHLAEEPDFVSRFKREAQSVSALNHPNIVQVFDFDIEGDSYYMAMAYVEGGRTLKEVLRDLARNGERLPISQVLDLTAKVADALGYAHQQGMIHRDVKPANILIKDITSPILSDFGIAHIVDSTTLTRSGATVGTPAYMAPEQGAGGIITARTDIYALGVTMYEMLTGRPPYEADTPYAVILKHISDPIVPPHIIVPLPEVVEPVVLKAMSKRPEYRFTSAEDMAWALREALESVSSDKGLSDTHIKAFDGYGKPPPGWLTPPAEDMETHEIDSALLRMPYGAAEAYARTNPAATEPISDAKVRAAAPPKQDNRWKFLAIGAGALLAGLFIWFFVLNGGKQSIPAAPPGTIFAYEIQGNVEITVPDEPLRHLKTGDTITVGAGNPGIVLSIPGSGQAVISLEDGSVLYIGPNTSMTLNSLINATRHSTGTVLTIQGGTFMTKVAPLQGNTFVIRTPVGTRADVLGSLMGVQYIDELQQFDTDCLEGRCRQFGGPGIQPLSLQSCQHSLVISVGSPEGPDPAHTDQYNGLFPDVVPDCSVALSATPNTGPRTATPTRFPLVPTITPVPTGTLSSGGQPTDTNVGPGSSQGRATNTAVIPSRTPLSPIAPVETLVAVPTNLVSTLIPTDLVSTLLPTGIVSTLVPDIPLPDIPIPDLPVPTVKVPVIPLPTVHIPGLP